MSQKREQKLEMLRNLARGDGEYGRIEGEYQRLESAFAKMVNTLPRPQQNLIWAYVCTSNELDSRLLEIAGDYLEFGAGEEKA